MNPYLAWFLVGLVLGGFFSFRAGYRWAVHVNGRQMLTTGWRRYSRGSW